MIRKEISNYSEDRRSTKRVTIFRTEWKIDLLAKEQANLQREDQKGLFESRAWGDLQNKPGKVQSMICAEILNWLQRTLSYRKIQIGRCKGNKTLENLHGQSNNS